jgi:hypothetical protein
LGGVSAMGVPNPSPLGERAGLGKKYNLMAKLVQINPNKSKENQAKKLGFPWIPLAESGLFNALQRFQIKKFPSVSTRVLGCRSKAFHARS